MAPSLTGKVFLLLFVLLFQHCWGFSVEKARPNNSSNNNNNIPTAEQLLQRAQRHLCQQNADAALATLTQVYSLDPHARGLFGLLESALRLKIQQDANNVHDRLGLASLLVDQERYEQALVPLREILTLQPAHQAATSLLFRTNAACCHWDTYAQDARQLRESLRLHERLEQGSCSSVPAVHPFEALKWPCISLEEATLIASLYARRAVQSTHPNDDAAPSVIHLNESVDRPTITLSRDSLQQLQSRTKRKLRVGYMSPDFTSKHPLAFLMQHVFQYHNRQAFSIHLYSLAPPDDDGPEVQHIQQSCDSFEQMSLGASAQELAEHLQQENLDILVDLCGYTGTALVAQVLSLRPAPVQVSYMGFPGSSGAPYLDYLVCDAVVVPPPLRKYYSEALAYMPHCYFVNSHATACASLVTTTNEDRQDMRQTYGLPTDNGFVFCCHSRPDKIDPSIFDVWLGALKRVRLQDDSKETVLWLLRSGVEMENNLRRIAREKFELEDEALVFADICPRDEHLKRLGAADLFLDTPAYNAHTLGCDTLYAGVPMITLLRDLKESDHDEIRPDVPRVETEKLASRVGASLLLAAGLEEMICLSEHDYEDLMVHCATGGRDWYDNTIRKRLLQNRSTSPLFDTRRWVQNLELAFRQMAFQSNTAEEVQPDIRVEDD